jgi:hypothetical protein
MQKCEGWEQCSNKVSNMRTNDHSVQLLTHINSTGAVHELRFAHNISILRFHWG